MQPDRAWRDSMGFIRDIYATKADLERVNASVAELKGEMRGLRLSILGIYALLAALIGLVAAAVVKL